VVDQSPRCQDRKCGSRRPAGKAQQLNPGFDVEEGTVIAEKDGIAQEVREARLKAASAYVADLLRNGEVAEDQYTETLEKYAQMSVQAILALATSTRLARERAKDAVRKAI